MIYTLIFLYLLFPITLLFYTSVMAFRLAKKENKLTGASKFFGYQILFVGLIIDVIFNVIIGTMVFLELPKEALFTGRCERWLHNEEWRGKVARWFCRELLNVFDKDHCGEYKK